MHTGGWVFGECTESCLPVFMCLCRLLLWTWESFVIYLNLIYLNLEEVSVLRSGLKILRLEKSQLPVKILVTLRPPDYWKSKQPHGRAHEEDNWSKWPKASSSYYQLPAMWMRPFWNSWLHQCPSWHQTNQKNHLSMPQSREIFRKQKLLFGGGFFHSNRQ